MLREQKGSAQDHTEPRTRIQLFSLHREFFPPTRSFHLPRPLLIVCTGHMMVSGAAWGVDLAWTPIYLTCTHSTNQLFRAREPSSDSSTCTLCFRLGCTPVFASALDSNLEIVEGNSEGLKEEERGGEIKACSQIWTKNRSEALESRAFASQKLFSVTAVIRVFHYLHECLLKFKTGSRLEHNFLADTFPWTSAAVLWQISHEYSPSLYCNQLPAHYRKSF